MFFTLISLLGVALCFVVQPAPLNPQGSNIEEAVRGAFFPGRSSNIVVTPRSEDALVAGLLQLSWDDGTERRQVLSVTECHRLLASVLSLPFVPLNSEEGRSSRAPSSALLWRGASAFTRPAANLLFVIEGSPLSLADPTLRPLRTVGWPYDTVSTLTSALSGTAPSTHGIIAQQWLTPDGNEQTAYRDAWPLVASIPDILTQYTRGHSLVVSVATDHALAAALGTRPALRTAHTHTLTWQPHSQAVDTFEGDSLFRVTMVDLETSLQTRRPYLNHPHLRLSYDSVQRTVTVDITDGDALSAQFALADEGVVFVFLEIETALRLVDVLKTTSTAALHDSHPDWFAFGFSALRLIEAKYGRSSVHYRILRKLVDYCIAHVILEMETLYSGHGPVAHELLYLLNPELDPAVRENIVSVAEHTVSKATLEAFYPRIYSPEHTTAVLCEQLEAILSFKDTDVNVPSHYDVDCQTATAARHTRYVQQAAPVVSPASPPTPYINNTSPVNVALFQIEFWTGITLAVLTIVVVYYLGCMETTQDPLLYRAIAIAHQKKTN